MTDRKRRAPIRVGEKYKLVAIDADLLIKEVSVATGHSESETRAMLLFMAAAGLAVVGVER